MTRKELIQVWQTILDTREDLFPGHVIGKDELRIHKALLKVQDMVFDMYCNAPTEVGN
jgi:hypothetical protein